MEVGSYNRKLEREKIEQRTKEYIANGGTITQVCNDARDWDVSLTHCPCGCCGSTSKHRQGTELRGVNRHSHARAMTAVFDRGSYTD